MGIKIRETPKGCYHRARWALAKDGPGKRHESGFRKVHSSAPPELSRHANLELVGALRLRTLHDLNNRSGQNGLTIDMIVRLLENEGVAKDHPVRRYLSELRECLEAQTSEYKNMLELGRKDEKTSGFSIAETVAKVCVSSQKKLDEKHIGMTIRFGDDIPLFYGSSQTFIQILSNFITNAMEAFKAVKAGKERKIRISVEYEAGKVVIAIKDTGCGISESDLAELFTPYNTHKTRGTGLGMCLAKHWVENEHGGKIEVSSKVGEGTTFILRLPVPKRTEDNGPEGQVIG